VLLGVGPEDDLEIRSTTAEGALDHHDDGALELLMADEHDALGHRERGAGRILRVLAATVYTCAAVCAR
jgi:hypothetical protein